MARTKDREFVSEAIRLGDVWEIAENWGKSVTLTTDCDEQLEIIYGNTGQIRFAHYQHWDRDTMETVYDEEIRKGKLKRVLQLLCAERGRDGRLYVRHHRDGVGVRVGSIADGLKMGKVT